MTRFTSIRTVAVVVLALAIAWPAATLGNPDSAPEYMLYAGEEQGRTFNPLDPMTLATSSASPPWEFANDWPQIAISADGSTSASISSSEGPYQNWITIHDGVLGAKRLGIDTPEPLFEPHLSADGSRLTASPGYGCGPSGCAGRSWYTYDTTTGNLISKVEEEPTDPVWPEMIDFTGSRLFVPFYERSAPSGTPASVEASDYLTAGPWPLQIAAYDLNTGATIGILAVPEVVTGNWQVSSADEHYRSEHVGPAIALSPDGSQIAVVDANMDRLTLIDTATLTVVATHDIHTAQTGLDWALQWLGLAPQVAEAKISSGRSLTAAFSADGNSLYVTGSELSVGATGDTLEGEGFGIMRLQVESGEIVAHAQDGLEFTRIMPAPDGSSVYAVRSETPWWVGTNSSANVLIRLEPTTLEPLAERTFADWMQILIVPTPPDSSATPGT